jgi:hypothetical protein
MYCYVSGPIFNFIIHTFAVVETPPKHVTDAPYPKLERWTPLEF